MKKYITLLCILSLLLTLVFPMATVTGMNNGIKICLYTLIPSFFPFLLINNVMLKYDLVKYISGFIAPVFSRLFKVSANGSFVVLMGFTCGYPMGVKTAHDLLVTGKISRYEFLHLIKFCNNPSLSFTINYVCYSLLNNECNIIKILICVYGSSIITGIISGLTNPPPTKTTIYSPQKEPLEVTYKNMNVFIASTKTLLTISSYVLIFSTLTEFMKLICQTAFLPYDIVITLTEITNGLNYFSSLYSMSNFIPLIIIALISGGASITVQTLSFLQGKEEIKSYAFGKLYCLATALFLYTTLK